jgi:hypothetical protein
MGEGRGSTEESHGKQGRNQNETAHFCKLQATNDLNRNQTLVHDPKTNYRMKQRHHQNTAQLVLKQADGSISIQTPETMNNTEYKLHSR